MFEEKSNPSLVHISFIYFSQSMVQKCSLFSSQAGNNWGSCNDQGVEGSSLGCGPQETFR